MFSISSRIVCLTSQYVSGELHNSNDFMEGKGWVKDEGRCNTEESILLKISGNLRTKEVDTRASDALLKWPPRESW